MSAHRPEGASICMRGAFILKMYNIAMDFLNDLNHHAYGLVGFSSDDLHGHLKKVHKISAQGNPDFFHQKYDTFGIDEGRRIKEMHSSKSFSAGSKKIFIVEVRSLTHEAQNSLLKIFEEPHEHTHFLSHYPVFFDASSDAPLAAPSH
jgi:hypothetical protein